MRGIIFNLMSVNEKNPHRFVVIFDVRHYFPYFSPENTCQLTVILEILKIGNESHYRVIWIEI